MKQDGKIGIVTANHAHPEEDWKYIRLSDVDLSVGTHKCLCQMGPTTLGELANVTDTELLAQPNFGWESLKEVRTLLSSIKTLTQSGECMNEPNAVDFFTIEEPTLSTPIQPPEDLDLTTRGRNVAAHWGTTTVGELAQLTESQLRATPNVGKLTNNNIKYGLVHIGLTLGTTIANCELAEKRWTRTHA